MRPEALQAWGDIQRSGSLPRKYAELALQPGLEARSPAGTGFPAGRRAWGWWPSSRGSRASSRPW